MEQQKVLLFVILVLTFMSSIECCKSKWNINSQSRAIEATTTHPIESMTTTEDFTETTTNLNTEIDFISLTTNNQDYNNIDTTITNNEDKRRYRLPGHSIDLSETYKNNRCLGLHEEAFCMNGGKCLNYTMPNAPAMMILSCECAEGFMGERCESKYWEGTYKLHDVPSYHDSNTIGHHIYERLHPKQHYESNSSPSLYRTAQVHPVTAITAGIVIVVSYCSYRMFLR